MSYKGVFQFNESMEFIKLAVIIKPFLMKNTFRTVVQSISGILAIVFLGNLLVHIPFYLIDGNLFKLFSPAWLVLNGITLGLCLVYVFVMKRGKEMSH